MRTTDFGMEFVPKSSERQILQIITHQNRNQHITMCPCIKLNFGTKLRMTKATKLTYGILTFLGGIEM